MAEQRARARAAWAGSGEAATEHVWFEIKEKRRRHRIPRLPHRDRRGRRSSRSSSTAHRSQRAGGRHRRRGGAEPDAVLRRERRPGRRHRRDHRRRRPAHRRHRHAEEARRPVRASRPGRGRRGAGRHARGGRRWTTRAAPPSARTTRATHLLHEALRRRLGTHVAQKGSLNAPDRLRFDVSQPRPITGDDLAWVEAEVNARIRENTEVDDPADDPRRRGRDGAMALFGEKYGDEVRVVIDGRAARATSRPGRSNCAAARMSAAPAISASSASSAKARSPPACAASRR